MRYGATPRRLSLLAGLQSALTHLRQAGCARAYLDGRFVTAKAAPNDFDACWEMAGVDVDLLDAHAPILLDWSRRQATQKALFGGELVAESAADPWGTPYLEFFRRDRDSEDPKGIVAINLERHSLNTLVLITRAWWWPHCSLCTPNGAFRIRQKRPC